MRQPRDQHWADLLEALEREADAMAGFGEITVRVRFHDGEPKEIRVPERIPIYRLGKTAAPLRGV